MIEEIYIRNPEDPNYVYGTLSHSDPIESIISKLKVIFGTHQGKVLGDMNFGAGLDELIFETKVSKKEIEDRIKRQITQYVSESSDYKIEPEVSFGKGDGYDYALVDIYIDDTKSIGVLIK